MLKTVAKNNEKYKCKYCNKEFAREKTVETHKCTKRDRFNERYDKGVIIGYETFQQFYRTATGSATKQKEYKDFLSSPYYRAFVLFGKYCNTFNICCYKRYAQHLIQNNVSIDSWTNNKEYKKFIKNHIFIESVEDALTRGIEFAIKWSKSKNMNYNDMFRYASTNYLCQAILDGHISPWMLYTCKSGQEFLGNLDHWQYEGIWDIIDSDKWGKIFNKQEDDLLFAKSTLKLGGW